MALEVYASIWLTRAETCSEVIVYVILKLNKYTVLLCRRKYIVIYNKQIIK